MKVSEKKSFEYVIYIYEIIQGYIQAIFEYDDKSNELNLLSLLTTYHTYFRKCVATGKHLIFSKFTHINFHQGNSHL